MVASYRVIINDCACPALPGLTHLRTRHNEFGSQNVVYSYESVVAGLPERLTPTQQDWLDILGALYATDLACPRGTGDNWARTIKLWVGVRNVDHWRPLANRFSQVFGALAYDELEINFVREENPAPQPRQSRKAFPETNCIALLSGGIDSLTGAGLLLRGGRVPLYISHQNSGAVGRALKAVENALHDIGPSAGRFTFTAHLQNADADSTQRSRSMLYMGIACLLATCLDLPGIYLNENGIMAINAPLTEARIGSYSTHTASPNIIRDFARLATTALGHKLSIRNILATYTKPEVVEHAVGLGLGDVLPDTVSCWWIGRTNQHCGYCIPCIVRQISCEYAGAPDVIYREHPLDHIPPDARWRDPATDNVVHLCTHVAALAEADDIDLELDFTELLNCGDQLTREQSFDMHRRWARQCLAILRTHPTAARFLGR